MTLMLETQQLLLRPFHAADLDAFIAYRSDPATARYQSWDVPYSAQHAAAFIAALQAIQPATPGAWYQLAIERKAPGDMIGDCAFCILADDPRHAEIGFTLAPAHRGHGYATAAVRRLLAYLFEEVGVQRVRAICDVENTLSIALLERLGMRRAGHVRERVWFKGRWSREYEYALLRQAWVHTDQD
jgi:RimJ/RimL family protein N-acetyltransferase